MTIPADAEAGLKAMLDQCEKVERGELPNIDPCQIDQRTGKPMQAITLVRDQECYDLGYAAGVMAAESERADAARSLARQALGSGADPIADDARGSTADAENILRILKDPMLVHRHMLRDMIAKPSPMNIIHLYGREAILEALAEWTPPGWKLVPVEPTKEMLLVMADAKWPEDWEAGKRAQIRLGFDVIAPECQTEVAWGQYERLLSVAPVSALPASPAAPSPQGWQTIESAPKDGTEIILYHPPEIHEGKPYPHRVTCGAWIEWEETIPEYHSTTGEYLGRSVQGGGASWSSWDGGFREESPPTHWMPLPSPPALSSAHGDAK
ncbi:hypothetical protein SAMN05519103_00307 [Rhizobiales bacterium GAS113]|nr:hypothetical protein SAMN05519103_00307 [Rhizobiales bacterium GAS113]